MLSPIAAQRVLETLSLGERGQGEGDSDSKPKPIFRYCPPDMKSRSGINPEGQSSFKISPVISGIIRRVNKEKYVLPVNPMIW
jgi:hypothetical protein